MKALLRNSDPRVLGPAIVAICTLLATEPLANSNKTKIAELDEALISSLRVAAGEGDIEAAAYNDDQIIALVAVCSRISLLVQFHDLGPPLEDDDGGKASSGWTILLALARRGSRGYREEAQVRAQFSLSLPGVVSLTDRAMFPIPQFVDSSLEIMSRYLLWRVRSDKDDEARRADFIDKRLDLLEMVQEFAFGEHSNAVELVRKTVSLICPFAAALESEQC